MRDEVMVGKLDHREFDLSGPDSLRPLCRGLAVVVLTDLRRVPQLLLVERERLQVLLTELRLVKDEASRTSGSSGRSAVDPSTAPRYGRLNLSL